MNNRQEIEKKCKEYFSLLLNEDDSKKENVKMAGFSGLHRGLSREQRERTRLKNGKSTGIKVIYAEIIKKMLSWGFYVCWRYIKKTKF